MGKNGSIKFALSLIILTLLSGVANANIAVSGFGYHPEQSKQAISYTSSTTGTFSVVNADTNTQIFTGILSKPKDFTNSDTNCQGNQQCLVADFSALKTAGNYFVQSGTDKSPVFKISNNIFSERAPLFLDVFEALRQQDSSYHANLHSVETPPFLAMADGSFIMTTYQLAFAGIRMASAYNRNPQLFSLNKYTISTPNSPDLAEHIKLYVDMMKAYQDTTGTLAVPDGYFYNFNCALDYDPSQPRYTATKDACLQWKTATSSSNSAQALLLYAESIPIIYQIEGQSSANALLDRAKKTYQHIKANYPGIADDDAAFYGAALFLLHDFTGELQYLQEAHSQRSKVNKILDSEMTKGREFYWEEYARHKQAILNAGLPYEIDAQQPEHFFNNKIQNDWTGWNALHAISRNGERVYILNDNMDFQQTRFTLIEAVTAAKSLDLNGQDAIVQSVADSQLAWLTGMNSIQSGDFAGPLSSKSFIFGIGNFGKNQHLRLVSPNFYNDGRTFLNGMKYVAGWISGSFDSFNDADKIFNYDDTYWNWRYTETTNEVMAAALELSAYLDAKYNNKVPLMRPKLTGIVASCTFNGKTYSQGQQFAKDSCNTCTCNADSTISCTQNVCVPPNTTNTTQPNSNQTNCYSKVNDIPATCTATITLDAKSGCRTIACSSGTNSIKILACNKPDGGPLYFEMYRQSFAGVPPKICLAGTCMQNEGYKKSPNYPICAGSSTPPTTCTPTTETCDSKDNDCDGQIDEGGVCGTACTPATEVCDEKDNNCNGQIDENNVCAQKCHSSITTIPATCTSSITQDTKSGTCRTVACGTTSNSIKVMGCDKPDFGTKTFFEVYRQSFIGSPPKICFGPVCIQSTGYAKSSSFPICT